MLFPISKRTWSRMEQKASRLIDAAGEFSSNYSSITVSDPRSAVLRKNVPAFSLGTLSVPLVAVLEDKSIVIKGWQIKHYHVAQRTSTDRRTFRAIVSGLDAYLRFVDTPRKS